MPQPRTYQTEAIIIKKTKLGEADRILTLFTPHLGKVQAVAKGVRRPRSKLSGHLEMLTYSTVSLVRGRTLDTITGSQTIDSFLPLKSDLWLTSCALYVAELVNQFTADEMENYPLFQLLLATLKRLTQPGNQELVLRYFEVHLLEETGYRPELRECVSCHRALDPVAHVFCFSLGGIVCPFCSPGQAHLFPLSVNAQKVLKFIQSGDLPAIERLKIDAELSDELERALGGYIRHILERGVKSATWLEALREEIRKTAP